MALSNGAKAGILCCLLLFLVGVGLGAYFLHRHLTAVPVTTRRSSSSSNDDTVENTRLTTTPSPSSTAAPQVIPSDCSLVTVHRKVADKSGHMDSLNPDEGGSAWTLEGSFRACTNAAVGTKPVYRGVSKDCVGGWCARHRLSLDRDELLSKNFLIDFQGPAFHAYTSAVPGSVPFYQLRRADVDAYMTSTNEAEGSRLGYVSQGQLFHAFPTPPS